MHYFGFTSLTIGGYPVVCEASACHTLLISYQSLACLVVIIEIANE